MGKICAQCVHYEHKVGCLHLGTDARFGMACHATTSACPHYKDPADPENKACATCRFLLADEYGRGVCHAPKSSWPERSDVRCKVWAARTNDTESEAVAELLKRSTRSNGKRIMSSGLCRDIVRVTCPDFASQFGGQTLFVPCEGAKGKE